MPKFTHHFVPLNPPVPKGDLPNIKRLLTVPFTDESGVAYKVHLFGKSHIVNAIGITLPEGEKLQEHSFAVARIVNHMLSALRLRYRSDADAIRIGNDFVAWEYEGDFEEPTYMLEMELGFNDDSVDVAGISEEFSGTITTSLEPVIALLAEATSPIPVHYKILSLVRALELLFPDKADRAEWLDKYEAEFSGIGISSKQFRNALHELRTRCAHGVSRGNPDSLVDQVYSRLHGLGELVNLLRRVVGERVAALRFG